MNLVMDSKSSPILSTKSSSPNRIIKKEACEEEIKEFAETAMNELLGWYGYERLELRRWAAARPSSPSRDKASDKDECSWCNNPITTEVGALHQSGAKFCSEVCFSQSRRANFKRAKTCDWCRHVRHTVAYVDFQDGATQLQFCSDKCLNQYKMHIFCRETQAHLDLNPHLVNAASTSNLITPELWMKNCRSRSASPASDCSSSPTVENLAISKVPVSATEILTPNKTAPPKKSPLPIISVAPPSKLMKPKHQKDDTVMTHGSPDSKKDTKISKINLRKRRNSRCSATVTSQSLNRQATNSSNTVKTSDPRLCSPPSNGEGSPRSASSTGPLNNSLNSPTHTFNPLNITSQAHPNIPNPMFGLHPPPYMDGFPNSYQDPRLTRPIVPPTSFMHRFPQMFNQERLRLPTTLPYPPLGLGQPPPVTVLVPYPVVIPIPLPIPVPIPIAALFRAYNMRNDTKPGSSNSTSQNDENADVPLDFTINRTAVSEADSDENLEVGDEKETESKGETEHNRVLEVNLEHDKEEILPEENPAPGKETDNDEELCNPEQKLPRFKITRLDAKMAKIVSKPREESECTRPLRKRRRIVKVSTDEESLLHKAQKIVPV